MKVIAEITAVCITIEDDVAVWTPDAVQTFARIAADEAMRVYRQVDVSEDFGIE